MKNKFLPQLFIIYLRYLIGFAFVINSFKKFLVCDLLRKMV